MHRISPTWGTGCFYLRIRRRGASPWRGVDCADFPDTPAPPRLDIAHRWPGPPGFPLPCCSPRARLQPGFSSLACWSGGRVACLHLPHSPASSSSPVTNYAWLRRQKVTTSPDRRASLTPPTALDSGAVRSNLTSSPRLHMPTSLSARCGCCSLYARLQAWLLHVAGEVVVSNSCGNISGVTSQVIRSLCTHFIFKSLRIIAFRQVYSNNT